MNAGGGLLMLGGRHTFTEGGHRDSVLHGISPVVMPDQAEPEFKRPIKIRPTDAAWVHPALIIAESSEKIDRPLADAATANPGQPDPAR